MPNTLKECTFYGFMHGKKPKSGPDKSCAYKEEKETTLAANIVTTDKSAN